MSASLHVLDNTEDVIDSREVIERIETLQEIEELTEDEQEELANLLKLAEQCEGYGDWEYGETLVRDSYFEDYAQELAEDIGAINRTAAYSWPISHVDWSTAAEALKQDYLSVDFNGVDYWMRA